MLQKPKGQINTAAWPLEDLTATLVIVSVTELLLCVSSHFFGISTIKLMLSLKIHPKLYQSYTSTWKQFYMKGIISILAVLPRVTVDEKIDITLHIVYMINMKLQPTAS